MLLLLEIEVFIFSLAVDLLKAFVSSLVKVTFDEAVFGV